MKYKIYWVDAKNVLNDHPCWVDSILRDNKNFLTACEGGGYVIQEQGDYEKEYILDEKSFSCLLRNFSFLRNVTIEVERNDI